MAVTLVPSVLTNNSIAVGGSGSQKTFSQGDFQGVLNNLLNQVEDYQHRSDQITEKLITGNVENMHQVVFAMEQAKLTLELAVQVRNKIVDAYQEVMRMQV